MAQFTERDVRRVAAAVAAVDGERQSGPVVRPEDVERVRAVTDESDPALRARKMEAWLAEVKAQLEANSRRLESLRAEAGVAPLRESKDLSPEAKAEMERALEGYASEIRDEVRREAKAATGQQVRSSRPPRPGRLRV